MSTLLAQLRSGAYLTHMRIRRIAIVVLCASAAALVYLYASAHGISDSYARPLGTDFSDVYAAGLLANEGRPAAAYDFVLHYDRERALFGNATPFYGWHYPPFLLLIAAALANLPYLAALLLWQGVGLALYLWAMRSLMRTAAPKLDAAWWIPALAFPAVYINLTHGQNGFLTCALFAGALALLTARPFRAGLLFGLVVYKPQFAILLPIALIAARQWSALAGAAIAIAGLSLAASLAFGLDIWQAFFASLKLSREVVLEQGGAGFEKIISLFASLRHLGSGVKTAYLAQGLLGLALAWPLIRLWRAKDDPATQGAVLCLTTLLVTPYALDYDLMLAAPAIALIVMRGLQRGFAPYQKTALAALWLVPLFARTVAGTLYLPLAFAVLIWVLLLTIQKKRPCESLELP